jgi:hypothetical protein
MTPEAMTPELWKRVEEFFDEVVGLPTEVRTERLEAIRETDPEFYVALKSLLEADDEADELLGGFEHLVTQLDFEPPSDPVPRLNAALEGRYVIDRELGQGGMAIVYLADDLKHGRNVALKVLRPELAAVVGAERFLTEIKTTANLQHPNILPLHDSGEADGFVFYVMPYVDGDTLKDRLDREGQLPVSDAVAIARDIAEALQAAHEQGVIHRDIKPANVLISRGKPLVADFGIALAVSSAGAVERLTEGGLSLGTPHYMSPEQTTGERAVGPAADTWALGCVLYEMLVGEPPYAGGNTQAVLGKIIAGKPVSAKEERPSVPPNVDAAIRMALEKLPADRFTSVQDFARALGDEHFRYGEFTTADADTGSLRWNRLSIGFAGLAALLAVTVLALASPLLDRPAPDVVRFDVEVAPGEGSLLGGGWAMGGRPTNTGLAFSPDGGLLVYLGGLRNSRLYLHRLDQDHAEPIAGTEGASIPFFSPDGAWIGFIVGRSLKRVSVVDGTTETIVPEAPVRLTYFDPRGATWGDDETIVYGAGGNLYRVASTGGEPELLVEGGPSLPGLPRGYGQPHMLPGSKALLFHVARSADPSTFEIVALDMATRTQTIVLTDAMDPRYVQTGHLLFMRLGKLMAVAFDPERLEARGQPVVMIEDVMHSLLAPNTAGETGAGQVAVSASGHIAYARGGVFPERARGVVRITTTGDTIPLEMDGREYRFFRVSPDGSRIAAHAGSGRRMDIWVHDRARGMSQPLNTGGFRSSRPAWSPDGRWIAYSSDRDRGFFNVYRVRVDGVGQPEPLAPSDRRQVMSSWSSQGVIAWLEQDSLGSLDIWVMPPAGDAAPFFESYESEVYASFSPDGEWLAYVTRDGVFVQPYPGPGPATLIADDGEEPAWSHDGRQIFYIRYDENRRRPALMAVDVTPGDEFLVGRPVLLIDNWTHSVSPIRGYDVLQDGSILTVLEDDGSSRGEPFGATELHVVLNWTEELKERVGN